MITNSTLLDIQDKLMESMTALYMEDRDDPTAQYLAGQMIKIHEYIDIEMMERSLSK